MFSIGKKFVVADLVLNYVLVAALFMLTGDHGHTYFIKQPLGIPYVLAVLATLFSFLSFSALFSRVEMAARFSVPRFTLGIGGDRIAMLFALLFLLAAAGFFLLGMTRHRYDDIAASEQLSVFLLIVLVGKSVVSFQALYILIDGYKHKVFYRKGWYWPIVCLALALSSDGTMSALLFIVVTGITLLPRVVSPLLFSVLALRSPKFVAMSVLLPALMIVGVLLVWIVGEAVKRDSLAAAGSSFFNAEGAVHLFYWLSDRVSTQLYSVNIVAKAAYEQTAMNLDGLQIILENFTYRLCEVASGLCSTVQPRPELAQVSHLNYFNITSGSPLLTAGASPGVIASALYIFPPSLAPLLAGFYYYIVSFLMDYGAVEPGEKLSLLGYLAGLFLLRGVLLNPADMLLIISTPFIFLVTYIHVSVVAHNGKIRAMAESPAR
jgi:hypothetical protein